MFSARRRCKIRTQGMSRSLRMSLGLKTDWPISLDLIGYPKASTLSWVPCTRSFILNATSSSFPLCTFLSGLFDNWITIWSLICSPPKRRKTSLGLFHSEVAIYRIPTMLIALSRPGQKMALSSPELYKRLWGELSKTVGKPLFKKSFVMQGRKKTGV